MTRTTRARSGFNPRPRTGGDRAQAQFVHDPDVSIRAPARGATRTQDAGPPGRSCFNPRPRTGGDHNGDAAHAPGEGFNPRPRTGGDSGAPGPLRQDDHLRVGRFVDAHHAMPIRWRARLRQLRLRCLGGARGHFAPSAPRRPVGGRGVRCVASGRECVRARHHGRCRISVRHENRGSAAPPHHGDPHPTQRDKIGLRTTHAFGPAGESCRATASTPRPRSGSSPRPIAHPPASSYLRNTDSSPTPPYLRRCSFCPTFATTAS